MKSTELRVEGLFCEGCGSAVRRAIGQLGGVRQVDVNMPQKRVVATHDEAKAGEPAIRKRIEAAGFDVAN